MDCEVRPSCRRAKKTEAKPRFLSQSIALGAELQLPEEMRLRIKLWSAKLAMNLIRSFMTNIHVLC